MCFQVFQHSEFHYKTFCFMSEEEQDAAQAPK